MQVVLLKNILYMLHLTGSVSGMLILPTLSPFTLVLCPVCVTMTKPMAQNEKDICLTQSDSPGMGMQYNVWRSIVTFEGESTLISW